MRLRDTTSPIPYRRHLPIFTEQCVSANLLRSQALHFELLGLFYSETGPQWDSHGRAEGDCFHHIDLVIHSDAWVRHGERELQLQPGHAYFFPGNTPIVRKCSHDYKVLWLRFRCSWFSGLDPLLHWPERTPLDLGPWDPEEWLVPLEGDPHLDARMILRWQSRLTRWFADALHDLDAILREHATAYTQFAPVFDLIEEKLSADLRLEELAHAYGASVRAFSKRFVKALGLGPKAYLSSRLNQRAISMVLGTSLTMKEIAAALRFSDEYYFSRFFTRMNGQPPSRYRHEMQSRDTGAAISGGASESTPNGPRGMRRAG